MSEPARKPTEVREFELPEERPSAPGYSGNGGWRPGSGRPKGARNKIAAQIKELLAPLDTKAIARLEKIIERGSDREALEAIRLAWEYRFGKPRAQDEGTEGLFIAGATSEGAFIVAAGDERSYLAALGVARGES